VLNTLVPASYCDPTVDMIIFRQKRLVTSSQPPKGGDPMRKTLFVILLVILLLSLTLSVAMAGVDWEDPQPPGTGHNNGNGANPVVKVPANAACNGNFVGAKCP
jgi:hypothetical protein